MDSFRLIEPSNSALIALKERINKQHVDWTSCNDVADDLARNDLGPDVVAQTTPQTSVSVSPSRPPLAKQSPKRTRAYGQSPEPRRREPNSPMDKAHDRFPEPQRRVPASPYGKAVKVGSAASSFAQRVRSSGKEVPESNMSVAVALTADCEPELHSHSKQDESAPFIAETCLVGDEGNNNVQAQTGHSNAHYARAPSRQIHEFGLPRVPSVVTFGGQPVAADGELIYLGGGLYAAAAPPAPKEHQTAPKRVLPGRIQPGPRAPVGHTRLVPSRSPSAASSVRAHHRRDLHSAADNEYESSSKVTPAWRPAGAAKLSQAPHKEHPSFADRVCATLGDIPEGGGNSETRARERANARREGGGIFGPDGLLREIEKLREGTPRHLVIGAPHNSEARAAQRRITRKAQAEKLLAERAERLEVEKLYRQRRVCSTPSLRTPSHVALSGEDLERQMLKVACKMEAVDLFNAYASNISKMNAKEAQALLEELNGPARVRSAASAHCLEVASEQNPAVGSRLNQDDFDIFLEWANQEDAEQSFHESSAHQKHNLHDIFNDSLALAEVWV